MLVLLAWIAAQTGLAVPPPPPVELIPKEEMSRLAYGRNWQAGDEVQALYHWGRAAVYLHEEWSEDNLHCLAALLHELVHHVQAFNRVPYECPAARERQAYSLSVSWLREQGATDPYLVLNIDRFTIAALSFCGGAE